MTLTKKDLQSIGELIDQKLSQGLAPLKSDVSGLKSDIEQIKKAIRPIKSMQKTLNTVKKDLNYVIGKYDSRLNHLEKHSSHPPGRIAD